MFSGLDLGTIELWWSLSLSKKKIYCTRDTERERVTLSKQTFWL